MFTTLYIVKRTDILLQKKELVFFFILLSTGQHKRRTEYNIQTFFGSRGDLNARERQNITLAQLIYRSDRACGPRRRHWEEQKKKKKILYVSTYTTDWFLRSLVLPRKSIYPLYYKTVAIHKSRFRSHLQNIISYIFHLRVHAAITASTGSFDLFLFFDFTFYPDDFFFYVQ